MSNALYLAWSGVLGQQAGAQPPALHLAAATQPGSAPADAGGLGPAMLVLVAIGSCVLAVWIIRCLARPGRLRMRNTPGRPNSLTIVHIIVVALLMILALNLAAGLLRQLLPGQPTTQPTQPTQPATQAATQQDEGLSDARLEIAAGAVGFVVWLAASLAVAAGTFRHGLSRGLGLSLRHWICDLGRAIFGYLAVTPLWVGLAILFAYVFNLLNIPARIHPALQYLSAFTPPWRLLAVFEAVILAPLAEEVFFRGLVQSFFRRVFHSPRLAILLASAIFAGIHTNEPQAIPSLFALALALGYNYERTGRLTGPILIHAIFNAVNLAMWKG
jgi:membrane protease YdiL (CAAX protease family)